MPTLTHAAPTEQELNDNLGCITCQGIISVAYVSWLWVVHTTMKLTDDNDRLYGCTCGQVFYYFAHYYIPGDHAHVKALVCHFCSSLS